MKMYEFRVATTHIVVKTNYFLIQYRDVALFIHITNIETIQTNNLTSLIIMIVIRAGAIVC